MEIENNTTPGNEPNVAFTLNNMATTYLNETRSWGKFLAIVGFCFAALFVVLGLLFDTIFAYLGQENPFSGFIGIVYALLGLVYFFPAYYLYKFSTQLKTALAAKDTETLASAFENQKSLYKFMGIFMIIVIGFYVLGGLMMLFIALVS